MPVTESVIDEDVYGDGFMEGLTFAFDTDQGVEDEYSLIYDTDHDRLAYIQDVFEGSNDRITRWKSISSFSGTINTNGAEDRLFDSMKRVIKPCMESSAQLLQKPLHSLKPSDFAAIYLNRDWYFLLLDYINSRIEHLEDQATAKEVFELQRVWMLQCYYKTTATKLFKGASGWFAPAHRLQITLERYTFLFGKLGADLPRITVNAVLNDSEQDSTAEQVWGSFNQHNTIVSKLEAHVGTVGKSFLFERLTDVTIDDDKLRHTSKSFSDHGLQRCGFRGCRCGPVMNCAGSVQHGLIMSIYFSRKGDASLSIVKSLFRYLGYGDENCLKTQLDVLVLLDRGYNIASVIRFLLNLKCQLLGTHSEKAGKWPYCTTGNPKEWQVSVSVEGARTVLFSTRKINSVNCFAMCYRNGSKGVGMLHSTLPVAGHWDLVTNGSPIQTPITAFDSTTTETLYFRWMSSVTVFVACQGCTPWFEARVGHLTGTTALKILKTIKFVLHDHPELPPSIHDLLHALGLSLTRKSRDEVNKLSLTTLRNAYKTLGYKVIPGAQCINTQSMVDVVTRQHPSASLVFQKLVTNWCLTPIKKKGKDVIESFRQGHLAAYECNARQLRIRAFRAMQHQEKTAGR